LAISSACGIGPVIFIILRATLTVGLVHLSYTQTRDTTRSQIFISAFS